MITQLLSSNGGSYTLPPTLSYSISYPASTGADNLIVRLFYNPPATQRTGISGLGALTFAYAGTSLLDQFNAPPDNKIVFPSPLNPTDLAYPYIKVTKVSESTSGGVIGISASTSQNGLWKTPDGYIDRAPARLYADYSSAGTATMVFDIAFSSQGTDATIFASSRITFTATLT